VPTSKLPTGQREFADWAQKKSIDVICIITTFDFYCHFYTPFSLGEMTLRNPFMEYASFQHNYAGREGGESRKKVHIYDYGDKSTY